MPIKILIKSEYVMEIAGISLLRNELRFDSAKASVPVLLQAINPMAIIILTTTKDVANIVIY